MSEQTRTSRSGFFPPASRFFGGGGRTPAPITPPITAAPAPAAAPPPSSSNAEVAQAQADLRRASLKKRGFAKTIFAGDNGGWMAGGNTTPGPLNPRADGAPSVPGAKVLGS